MDNTEVSPVEAPSNESVGITPPAADPAPAAPAAPAEGDVDAEPKSTLSASEARNLSETTGINQIERILNRLESPRAQQRVMAFVVDRVSEQQNLAFLASQASQQPSGAWPAKRERSYFGNAADH